MAIKTNTKHAVATGNMAPVPSKSTSIGLLLVDLKKAAGAAKGGLPLGVAYDTVTFRVITMYPSDETLT